MHRFRILGMTDSPGHCELCGTYCPARRVAVEIIDADGAANGEPQYWGVVCAAEARSGRRDSAIARQLRAEAEQAGEYAATATPRRGRRSTAPRPLSRRAAQQLAAARAAEDRIVWFRASSPVPAALAADEANGCPWMAAEYRYLQAGRRRERGHYYADDSGRHVVVDATDAADVARFEACGFKADAHGPLSAWPPLADVLAATA